jgi:hypothetical protein
LGGTATPVWTFSLAAPPLLKPCADARLMLVSTDAAVTKNLRFIRLVIYSYSS